MARHGRQTRCWFILLFLCPNIAGAFGLRFLSPDNQAGRLVSYYLTGPYNAAFVMILSMSTANTAGRKLYRERPASVENISLTLLGRHQEGDHKR